MILLFRTCLREERQPQQGCVQSKAVHLDMIQITATKTTLPTLKGPASNRCRIMVPSPWNCQILTLSGLRQGSLSNSFVDFGDLLKIKPKRHDNLKEAEAIKLSNFSFLKYNEWCDAFKVFVAIYQKSTPQQNTRPTPFQRRPAENSNQAKGFCWSCI